MTARADRTKKRIFDTMVTLMGRRGYGGVSVDEVAAEAGVSKGTIYYHYTGKAEMMEALIKERLEPAFVSLEEIMKAAKTDAREALFRIMDTEFDFFYEQQDFARVIVGELWREDRGWRQTIIDLRADVVAHYEEILERGIKQQVFRFDLPTHYAAQGIFGVVATSVLDCVIFEADHPVGEVRHALKDAITNAVFVPAQHPAA